jgi:4-hydroxy-3-methylbut-2-enyl diphosphate reductase
MKKFQVPNIYRSSLISAIKEKRKQADKLKKDFSPTLLDLGNIQFYLARHFGFCYGVENAIEIAFNTIEQNPGKRIFLLSEMIHNPQVNATLLEKGLRFLQDTKGKELIPIDSLQSDDIVIIPAFGTTLEMEAILRAKGIAVEKYNTTCPFVEKVWNRSAQLAEKGYTIVVHGKPAHEETRATFSHAGANTPTVVVNDMQEAILLGKYITGEHEPAGFYETFKGRHTAGFDVTYDLKRIGVVNQTTQLASDTQAIAEYLKQLMTIYYTEQGMADADFFADTRDTLCYATNDNQSAAVGMLDTPADFAIVIGGYNSSNTTHLVELCEQKLPTYFINSPDKIIDLNTIVHYNFHQQTELTTTGFFPDKTPIKILITSGASCPDALVEAVMERLASFVNASEAWEALLSSTLSQNSKVKS